MGLFDFIKNEFIEVIEWVDTSSNTLVWKFQDKGNNIKSGAKLTVRESQLVVLMNEGEFGDVYQPGLHTLSTSNMPITTTLKSWKYGFESPFKVDIYFVNTRQFTDLKWGTSGPVLIRDAELGQVRLKAFGNFAIRISDAKKFITEFAGTNPFVRVDGVEEVLQGILSSHFAEVLAKAKISVLELAANYQALGAQLKPEFQKELDSYGLSLEKFFIENISLPEEVEKILDKKTELNILKGNLNEFNQMQGGIALENLSNNDAAGNMGGVGAGVVLTNLMAQAGQPQQPAAAASKTDLMDVLKQLGELKSQGIITEEEFAEKKKEILARL
ncbi:SPFH domain-containing protein [Niabella sp. CC-SYL272]|uniref:SPFH domain-containing protein n=1 Tax=Niabella agricola TaxID=2891571 RepID=UPI001F27CC03|nr:SPFH domain-containing protein [Niabella agricola]MCF3109078.1 SPFH domain-containing protein [Niabella agricola]